MKPVIHLDYETRSPINLRDLGQYRYAEEAEILLMAFSVDDGEPYLWDYLTRPREHLHILEKAVRDGWRFYAHNSAFETAVSHFCLKRDIGITPPSLDQWFCTAAMCRRAGLPYALEKAAHALGLPEDQWKDPRGKTLIQWFSVEYGNRFRQPEDDIEAFREFGEYCKQDVRVEQAIFNRLKSFDFPLGGMVTRTWQLDKKINQRGVPVNIPAINEAIRVTQAHASRLSNEFREMTGLNPTQREKVLNWLRDRGYTRDNLQGVTLDKAMEEDTYDPDTTRVIEIKRILSFAAVSKLVKMRDCANKDGRVRGTLMYYGAGTGRWSGKYIQPQNFKRPSFKDSDLILDMLKKGNGDEIEFLWGNPQEAIASAIRHFISLPDEEPINDADYASVEARIVCWLAGQFDALEEYRAGIDRYVKMATIIYGKNEKSISKDERWMGKTAILGCGFGMGAKTFYEQATEDAEKYGITGIVVTKELCSKTVKAWRKKHSKVVSFWYDCENKAKEALMTPGKNFKAGEHITFRYMKDKHSGIPYLLMRLPSGRKIAYPRPHIAPNGTLTYWGQIPSTQRWGRVKLYAGKIAENATQAVAADVMAHGCINADRAGHLTFALIHDQGLSEGHSGEIGDYISCLSDTPEWAHGLPIGVEGEVVPYYTKT